MSKNEDKERVSNAVDKDSADGGAAVFVTYETIGYGLTSGNDDELQIQDSRYMSETTRLIEASEKDIAYKMTIQFRFDFNVQPTNKYTKDGRNINAEI